MLKNARNTPSSPLSKRTKTVREGYKEKKGGILGQNKTKEKGVTSETSESPGKAYTDKTKKRFGRTVQVSRAGGKKAKIVTKKDGESRVKRKQKFLGRAEKSGYAPTKYEGGGKVTPMKKKKAPQLAMSRDTRDWTEKELGVKNPSRAITKKEKDRRDSYRRGRYIKKPLSVMEKGGKVVAQGADKADIRAERKQERKEKRGAKAIKRADRKRRNKGYRQLKKDIKTGKLNPLADNMLKG